MNEKKRPGLGAKFLNSLLGLAIVLLLWQLGSMALNRPFLPTPGQSVAAFGRLLAQGALARHFAVSAFRILASILLAMALAVPLPPNTLS